MVLFDFNALTYNQSLKAPFIQLEGEQDYFLWTFSNKYKENFNPLMHNKCGKIFKVCLAVLGRRALKGLFDLFD